MTVLPAGLSALEEADALLVDFDGPMARLMPGAAAARAADEVRLALRGLALPAVADHIALLRHASSFPDRAAYAHRIAAEAETECARTCAPGALFVDLVRHIRQRGVRWAVVTNNASESVVAFLARFEYTPPMAICGREATTLDRMKPDPCYLDRALIQMRAAPSSAVFVGDSVTDVAAGLAAGVRVIGVARTPQRRDQLLDAGAVACVRTF